MKKSLSLIFIGILCIVMTGCGGSADEGSNDSKDDKKLTCTEQENLELGKEETEIIFVFDIKGNELKSDTYIQRDTYDRTSLEKHINEHFSEGVYTVDSYIEENYQMQTETCESMKTKGFTCSISKNGNTITRTETSVVKDVESREDLGEYAGYFLDDNYDEVKDKMISMGYACN